MKAMREGLRDGAASFARWARRYRLALGALLAVMLSGALALYNVSGGPLRNLNDIGGWENRALFIAMTAAVHAGLLLLAAALGGRVSPARVALRQAMLTLGLVILLLPINQKTYMFTQVTLPLIRAMEAEGVGVALRMPGNLSAPALALLYAVTRGPVYEMYVLKLVDIACVLLGGLLLTRAADRHGLGLRADALLLLAMILPQGLMNAGCSALPELPALALLAVSLTLLLACDRPRPLAAALCYGAACALCGACLYALPVYVLAARRGVLRARHGLAAAAVVAGACALAVAGGCAPGAALCSLLRANLGLPAYAGGAPNVMSLIPRAAVEEIPQYAPLLRHLAGVDTVTNAQPYYTQAHFEVVMRGFTLAGLAAYMGVYACGRRMEALTRAFALTLGALIVCPGVTSGAWLAADFLCLYAVVARPALRLPACMALAATAAASCYPLAEEVLLPMAYAFVLCLLALLTALGVIPMPGGKGETA